MKKSIHYAVPLAVASIGASSTAEAATDMFLNFAGEISGESADPSHKGAIDVVAWSWNMSREYDLAGPLAPPTVRAIKITKAVDSATSELAVRLIDGKALKAANLIVRSAGGKSGVEFLKIKMTDVHVIGLAAGGAELDAIQTETVALSFSEVCITYTPIVVGPSETTCWNLNELP